MRTNAHGGFIVDSRSSSGALIAAGVTVSLAVGAISYRLLSKPRESKNNPPPPEWPFLPGWLPLIGHAHLMPAVQDIVETCEGWAEQHTTKEIGCFEMELIGRRFLIISSEERAMEILQQRPFVVVRPSQVNRSSRSIGAKFLLEAEGEQWKQEHRLVAPALNRANVNDYLSTFTVMAKRLVKKWSIAAANGQVVTIMHDLSNLSADSIAKVSMDKDFDFLNSESQVGNDINKLLRGFVSRSMAPIPYWNIPLIGQYLDGLGWSIHRMTALVQGVLRQYEQQGHDESPASSSSSSKRTFVQKVYSLMQSNKETIPHDRLVGNVLGLFMAGTDTTSKAITSALYLIAENMELQEVLRKEADSINLLELTLESLFIKLPRIKSFFHEVHRWYGTPVHGLSTTQDIPFCGTVLPKGTDIMILTRSVSWQSNDVPRGPRDSPAHVFDPYRYLAIDSNGTISSVSPSTKLGGFLSFGHGVRACPGRVYSEALSYIVLVAVLQTFSFQLAPNHPKAKFVYDVVMAPDCDVRLALTCETPRQNDTQQRQLHA